MPQCDEAGEAGETGGGLRWDGRVSAGNLLTAVSIVVLVTVWGVRLEGRLNTEMAMRQDLAQEVTQSVQAVENQLAANDAHQQETDTDLKGWLSRIDQRLQRLVSVALRSKDVGAGNPMGGPSP